MSRNGQKIPEARREVLQVDAAVAIAVKIGENDVSVPAVDVEGGAELGELGPVDVAALVTVARLEQPP